MACDNKVADALVAQLRSCGVSLVREDVKLIESALAERDAGEAERVREAVARERAEALARSWWEVSRPLCVWHATYNRPTAVESSRTEAEAWSKVADVTAPLADDIARAIESALAERDAGEAERTAQAVAAERERAASVVRSLVDSLGEYVRQSMHANPEWRTGIRAAEAYLATIPRAAPRTNYDARAVGRERDAARKDGAK